MEHALIIEKDSSTCELHTLILKDLGFHVQKAINFTEALSVFMKGPVDFLVTEFGKEPQEEKDFVFAIKKENPNMPIIAITNSNHDALKERFKDTSGIYFVRNNPEEEIMNQTRKMLSKYLSEKELLKDERTSLTKMHLKNFFSTLLEIENRDHQASLDIKKDH